MRTLRQILGLTMYALFGNLVPSYGFGLLGG